MPTEAAQQHLRTMSTPCRETVSNLKCKVFHNRKSDPKQPSALPQNPAPCGLRFPGGCWAKTETFKVFKHECVGRGVVFSHRWKCLLQTALALTGQYVRISPPENMGCLMLANSLKASRALRIMLRAQRGGHTLALSILSPALDTQNPA